MPLALLPEPSATKAGYEQAAGRKSPSGREAHASQEVPCGCNKAQVRWPKGQSPGCQRFTFVKEWVDWHSPTIEDLHSIQGGLSVNEQHQKNSEKHGPKPIGRRTFLKVLGMGTGVSVLAACAPRPALPEATSQPTAAAQAAAQATQPAAGQTAATSGLKEAPMLADMVKRGELPPVEQRISDEPLVVQPIKATGQYGGTWRRAYKGISDFHAFGRLNYETVLRWPRDPKDSIQPGLAKERSWSDDGKVLTLVLRKGLKWSDGKPFTTADIAFWWNDIELDPRSRLRPMPNGS